MATKPTKPTKKPEKTEATKAEEKAEAAEAAEQTGVPHDEQMPPAAEPAPDTDTSEEQAAGEPGDVPPADSGSPTHQITIEGEGTIPVYAEGAMTRFQRGEKIEVTDAQLEAIKAAGVNYKGK